MSKVELLEIDSAYWKVQIGSKVQDLEIYPIGTFPWSQIQFPPSIATTQNLTKASVCSVPSQILVPVSRQSHIPVPAQIFIPSSVAISQPPLCQSNPLLLRSSEHSVATSHPSEDQAQLERLQELLLPEIIPKPEDISVQSTNSSRDRA